MTSRSAVPSEPSPWLAGMRCRCPRCGRGHLFKGFLVPTPACEVCGLDLRPYDEDDGPAALLILLVGFVCVFGALIVEIVWSPPAWVHLVIWLPLAVVGVVTLLRSFKGVRVALQYHHR